MGCHTDAKDGDIGRIKGMLVDEDTWAIRYLIVETAHGWSGHKAAPAYSLVSNVARTQEIGIYNRYERTGY
jgi:hypothetical protein